MKVLGIVFIVLLLAGTVWVIYWLGPKVHWWMTALLSFVLGFVLGTLVPRQSKSDY